LTDSPN